MKKIMILFLLTVLCLTACGKSEKDGASTEAGTSAETKEDSSSEASSQEESQESPSSQSPENTTSEASSSESASEDADTSANVKKYELSIPDDFASMDIKGMEFYYVNEDGSSISLNVQPKDTDFDAITADALRQALSAAIAQTYDEEVMISDNYFTTNTVSGYPAYQYSFSYTLQETSVSQLVIGIDGDQTYTFTFTDLSGAWMNTFETSAGTIRLTAE